MLNKFIFIRDMKQHVVVMVQLDKYIRNAFNEELNFSNE
jgi:hypothetical protein